MDDFYSRKAIREAQNIIKRFCIKEPDEILIEEIAWTLGLVIKDELLHGACARLLRIGDKGIIRVSDKIKENGQRRFAVAHEIGHFVLHKSLNQLEICHDKDLATWNSENAKETEANYFASELLMPEALFASRCDLSKVSFKELIPLAKEFQTSLTATALRLVQFCPESCAVIVSENGKIKWHRKSSYCYLRINNGSPLDKRTLAYEYFADREVPRDMEEVEAAAWASSGYQTKREIWENSIAMSGYDAVLTLLWIPSD